MAVKLPLQLLDESSDMEGLDVGKLANAALVAPFRKPSRGVEVRLARVIVVDLGGEEIQRSPGCLPCWRE
ncbi:MAG TPA: hypothetical protein VKG25_08290 [Bryobacteraceae bacterium]|nr:hypothetical protein [Bryobacteraceae bacterium]